MEKHDWAVIIILTRIMLYGWYRGPDLFLEARFHGYCDLHKASMGGSSVS